MELTRELCEVAVHHPCGELAWPSKHVRWGIRRIADLDLAVLGWEVWSLDKRGIVCGVLLRDYPNVGTVAHCEAQPRKPQEPWSDFVARTAEECISALDTMQVESKVIPEQANWLLYNLAWVDEQAHGRLRDR